MELIQHGCGGVVDELVGPEDFVVVDLIPRHLHHNALDHGHHFQGGHQLFSDLGRP